VGKKYGKIGL